MMKLKKSLIKLKKQKKTIDREKLVYRASEYTYNFRNFRTVRTLGRDVYEGKITSKEVNTDEDNLLSGIRNFNNRTRPQNIMKYKKKGLFLKTCINFLRQEKYFLMVLRVKYFQ